MRAAKGLLVLLVAGCGDRYDEIIQLEGDPVVGQFIYEGNCVSCHGAEGEGVSGPALTERVAVLTSTEILQAIDEGPGDMPAFDGEFDDQEMADLLEYLTLTFQ